MYNTFLKFTRIHSNIMYKKRRRNSEKTKKFALCLAEKKIKSNVKFPVQFALVLV